MIDAKTTQPNSMDCAEGEEYKTCRNLRRWHLYTLVSAKSQSRVHSMSFMAFETQWRQHGLSDHNFRQKVSTWSCSRSPWEAQLCCYCAPERAHWTGRLHLCSISCGKGDIAGAVTRANLESRKDSQEAVRDEGKWRGKERGRRCKKDKEEVPH